VFLVDVAPPSRIERVRLIPVRLNFARVDLATGNESTAICRRMVKRCAALDTRAAEIDGTLAIECAHAPVSGDVSETVAAIEW
jgi:hypothetical protein